MAIVFVGMDLAKNVFAVNDLNEAGKAELVRPCVTRAKLGELIAALPPCTVGLEACAKRLLDQVRKAPVVCTSVCAPWRRTCTGAVPARDFTRFALRPRWTGPRSGPS